MNTNEYAITIQLAKSTKWYFVKAFSFIIETFEFQQKNDGEISKNDYSLIITYSIEIYYIS